MPQPRAEVTISVSELEELINRQFPSLAPSRAVLLGTGWDNWAYCVNDRYVFRFPRRQIAVPLIEREVRLMAFIAARVRLAVPVPLYVGRADSLYPWPFAGHELIPGRTACVADLNESQRSQIAPVLAEFLRSLHSIPAELALAQGAVGDEIGRLDLSRRITQARYRLDMLIERGLLADAKPLLRILNLSAMTRYPPRMDTLVHGDLYARHLIVDPADDLTGIIDWGDLHVGDAAVDLAIAYTFLPSTGRAEFCHAYGEIQPDVWTMARFRALYHTLAVRLYAEDLRDVALIAESSRALRYLGSDL